MWNKDFSSSMRPIVIMVIMLSVLGAQADHYFGGYFYYETLGDREIEVSLITFTDHHNDDSDRDSVKFQWGDGTEDFLIRINGTDSQGEELYEGVQKNIYRGQHTYGSYANYQLHFSDNYRLFDVDNFGVGKSGVTNLRFDGLVPINNPDEFCINNSPIPLNNPYFFAEEATAFELNFNYYDAEGDSLSFELVDCKGANGASASGYFIPGGVSIDQASGVFTWDSPEKGVYSFSFEVSEYRLGKIIGKSSTDFTLFVSDNETQLLPRGSFTGGPTNGARNITLGQVENFQVSYSHPEADSLQITTSSPYYSLSGASLVSSTPGTNFSFSANLDLTVSTAPEFDLSVPIILQVTAYLGEDSLLLDSYTFETKLSGVENPDCIVPSLEDTFEIAPLVPALKVAPNLFEDFVWINLGTNYEDIEILIFDTGGKLVRSYFAAEAQTVKLDLFNLAAGMYFINIFHEEERIVSDKMIKK